ncbi:MAG: cytochrome c3 family protein [Eggerthellaceae bacterium]|jgi:hypothetical protein|nr:cytochrome c3 family protein [Eggerthellaceae bacterium]MDR2716248.1 cytochrome c3 family protein [Coriobacteriaceae bacterium]
MSKPKLALIACVLSLALGAGLFPLASCAPNQGRGEASADASPAGSPAGEGGAAWGSEQIGWTPDSDCAICHEGEAGLGAGPGQAQAAAHRDEDCGSCHSHEAFLAEAHEGVTFADRPSAQAKGGSVDSQACIACHGSLGEMAQKTGGSTALADSNGLVVNPHSRPPGATHDESPATCTDCHNNHSENLGRDAVRYCAQCHHRGTFQCGTCHELRN